MRRRWRSDHLKQPAAPGDLSRRVWWRAPASARRRVRAEAGSSSLKFFLRTAVALSLVFFTLNCTRNGRGANAAGSDSERQSDSEYDVARDLFLSRHDPRGALAHAQKAVELNDQNADAAHFVALIYLYFCGASPVECHLPEAERAARRAVLAKADFREAQNTLGVVLTQEKKLDDAIAVLKPLANDILYQTPWDAWGNLGLAYLEKGKIDEAVEALRRSVASEPRFCVGNYRLGLAYEKKGDLRAAREALSRAVETDRPECRSFQDAFEARARVYTKSKSCDLARSDLERCREISAESFVGQRCVATLRASPC